MKKKKKAPEGAPEWMVTFGDLMSLLLTFFVLLFSVSEVKQKKIYEMIRSIRIHWQVDAPTAGFHIQQFSDIVNLLAEASVSLPDQAVGAEGKTSETVENPFGKYAHVSKVNEDLRVSIEGKVLFEQGSTELQEEGRALLEKIRARVQGYPNRIRIVGHTSPEPMPASSPYDHFDLGFQRAKAVRAVLVAGGPENGGVRPERVELASGGRYTLIPGLNLFDPADRARLRRVEIIVTPERVRFEQGSSVGTDKEN